MIHSSCSEVTGCLVSRQPREGEARACVGKEMGPDHGRLSQHLVGMSPEPPDAPWPLLG